MQIFLTYQAGGGRSGKQHVLCTSWRRHYWNIQDWFYEWEVANDHHIPMYQDYEHAND